MDGTDDQAAGSRNAVGMQRNDAAGKTKHHVKRCDRQAVDDQRSNLQDRKRTKPPALSFLRFLGQFSLLVDKEEPILETGSVVQPSFLCFAKLAFSADYFFAAL